MAKCYELLRAVLAINYSTQTERDLVCVLTFIDRKELICEELIYPKKELVCVLLFTGKMSFQIRSKQVKFIYNNVKTSEFLTCFKKFLNIFKKLVDFFPKSIIFFFFFFPFCLKKKSINKRETLLIWVKKAKLQWQVHVF